MIVALFRAGGARAGVAQPLETKVGAMAVVPLDVHSGTGSDVHFDGLGIDHGHVNKYTVGNRSLYSEGSKQGWKNRVIARDRVIGINTAD